MERLRLRYRQRHCFRVSAQAGLDRVDCRNKGTRTWQKVFLVFLIWLVPVVGVPIFSYYFPPTPEQLQQIKSEQEATRTAKQAKDDRTNLVCTAKQDCEEWKDLRRSCASAGDFDKCVSVKMEATPADPSACTRYSTAHEMYPEISVWDCLSAGWLRWR